MSTTFSIQLERYRPEQDDQPWQQTVEVPYHRDTSVLDALNYIKDHIDPTLSYRWSCRMAICGSCGVMINDEPRLGCKTFLRDYLDDGQLTVRAMDNFPIERDLIADIGNLVGHIESVDPFLIAGQEKPLSEGEYLQTPLQLERYEAFSECINCGLCYAACPQFGRNPEFLGPAAITLAQRYNLDSRDEGMTQRLAYLNAEEGVWSCTFVGYCSEVCPKAVDPAAAINQGKVSSTLDFVQRRARDKANADDG